MNRLQRLPAFLAATSIALCAGLAHGQASTLSKAVPSSASMEPALSLPAQEQASSRIASLCRALAALVGGMAMTTDRAAAAC